MRAACLVVLVLGMLAGCVPESGAPGPSPAAGKCNAGFSSRVDIHLSVGDNRRSITAHLCNAIDVLLVGPSTSQWQSIESSNASVLSVVPLPLPGPPPGGAQVIYLADRTGSTVLSSVDLSTTCANQAATCRTAVWSVTVTAVT